MIKKVMMDSAISELEKQIPWNIRYFFNTDDRSELTVSDKSWLKRSNKIGTLEYQLKLQYEIATKASDMLINVVRASPGYDRFKPLSALGRLLLA